jgi:hypothetical protein
VQYADLNATLQSLLSEKAVLERFMNQSTSLNESLQIETQIQNVQSQINQIQSQIVQTQTLVSYSTVTISFVESRPSPSIPISLKLSATPKSGDSPLDVTFNAVITGGSSEFVVSYNFGDGNSAQGQSVIHEFDQAGTFNVTVTVSDSNGDTSEGFVIIQVFNAPIRTNFIGFAGMVTTLFLNVIEGIVEVAVIVLPVALISILVYIPVRRFLVPKRNATGTARS